MKIHEFQAKEILRKYGVAVPEGQVASSAEEAEKIAEKLGGGTVVVKAQIHAGGRGKGGGVKIAQNTAEAKEHADAILGMNLVTHQTGPEGKRVNKVLIEQGVDIARELYAGLVLDRAVGRVAFMVSTEGGVEIEKVAAKTPEKILKEWIDPAVGFRPFQATRLAFGLGLEGSQVKSAVKFFLALYEAYNETDASLAEINPLVVTGDGDILALDAKINFDDNALYRHKNIQEYRDLSEEAASEVEASRHGLNYIKLDGNVGCMVNGAGLAMSTMDIIKLSGGEPANFLDVGGSASAETVKQGFRIILQDQNVQAVLINIFGGIVRCDRVAQGIIDALSDLDLDAPVVVRLEGTNAEEAAELLENSPLEFTVAKSLKDAAEKSVAVAA
ncbi:MAG: ADP-forming succinate--CoA ligase subunit beta [Candidatus Marinimicrobia bacterium]|nr:ADP-forming succinate--CoA ligase subunit beta [Candidatus Neomarinimicrobiota bacterium]MCF7830111.1 ADP-forming succinate--CoA ligase subunit beta [Candidatus Neomarinimicrobiota bacterium]MCF7882158.1 ADP-forming succinate--CoA ligase subunit beta [Candidatus Neomarinimicrobiota bacterium]